MLFTANENKVISLKNYFKRGIWIMGSFLLLLAALYAWSIYDKNGVLLLIMYLISIIIFFYLSVVRRAIVQSKIANHFIHSIGIKNKEIIISTIPFSSFWGLINLEPINLTITNQRKRLIKDVEKYKIPKQTGKVCLLICVEEEFAIIENFFENFDLLIDEIEKFINDQNNFLE